MNARTPRDTERNRNRRERDWTRAEPLIYLDEPEPLTPHSGIRVCGGTKSSLAAWRSSPSTSQEVR
jgi:hypothetical protein